MEWQHPQWLYLILPLAAAWLALSLYSRRRRHRAAEAFVARGDVVADPPAGFADAILGEIALARDGPCDAAWSLSPDRASERNMKMSFPAVAISTC